MSMSYTLLFTLEVGLVSSSFNSEFSLFNSEIYLFNSEISPWSNYKISASCSYSHYWCSYSQSFGFYPKAFFIRRLSTDTLLLSRSSGIALVGSTLGVMFLSWVIFLDEISLLSSAFKLSSNGFFLSIVISYLVDYRSGVDSISSSRSFTFS